jgi:methionyl-tRNA synthetase
MAETRYLTTPLYYVNAEPHLGHTYTTVVCDTLARFHRSMGRDTFCQTGTDEHGDKIAQAAAAAGEAPRAYADRISGLFRSTWDTCGITYDHFIRTTDAHHVRFTQDVLQHVFDKGDIYFGEYGGNYCTGCERFYTDRELVGGKCPDHEIEPVWIAEENYFFRMANYQQALLDRIESDPGFITPTGYKNEVLGLLREPLEDLCISRPKSRLEWGIELPFDANYVCYVWFDALLNYASGIREARPEDWQHYWAEARHFIAKDIVKPHAVFWPSILLAADIPLFKKLHVHGYWNMGTSKMSKSLGNVIRPLEMRERFGMDTFRYFLLREMSFGQDAAFTEDAFITRTNADLANGLGNLTSRVLSMQARYFDGVLQPLVPSTADDIAAALAEHPEYRGTDADEEVKAAFALAEEKAPAHLDNVAFHLALEEIWKTVAACDKFIVETSPFKLWKLDERLQPRVGAILRLLCEALLRIARLIEPFMPETAVKIAGFLGADLPRLAEPPADWGLALADGHTVAKAEVLFPRIEIEKA